MVMRERILKSKLYKAVLWITLFSMSGGAILFSPMLFKRGASKPGLISIDNQIVTQKDFERTLMQQMERVALIEQQYGQYAAMLLKMLGLDDPKQTAIQTLIYESLVNKTADELKLDLSSEFVAEKLKDPTVIIEQLREYIPVQALERDGSINVQALSHALQRRGQTLADFELVIEQALRRNIVTDLVGSSVFIGQQEIADYFTINYLKHKYAIIKLPRASFKRAPASEQELQQFFEQENKASKRYWLPEKRAVVAWKFNKKDYNIAIDNEAVEAYYNAHKQKEFVLEPVQVSIRKIEIADEKMPREQLLKKAEEIRDALIKEPASFAQMAQEHSQDKNSAANGGLVGFIKRTGQQPAIEQAAFRLKNDGDISPIVQDGNNLIIIQRVERKLATYKPVASVKDGIVEILKQEKFKKLFVDEAQAVLPKISIEQKEGVIDTFAQQKHGVKNTIESLALDNSLLATKAFKAKKGDAVAFIDEQGVGVIIYVSSITKSYQPALQEVKAQVENDLYAQKATEFLQKTGKEVKKSLVKGESIEAIKSRFPVEVITSDWVTYNNPESFASLKNQNIPVEQLLFKGEDKNYVAEAHAADILYIAKIVESEAFDEKLLAEKRQEVMQELYKRKKELQVRGFIASLYKNATIKFMENNGQGQPHNMPIDF